MPLESATYINDLDVSNPASTDQLQQADDHLRLLKQVLKATFPNITGPVSSTQSQLSGLFSYPMGLISAWYGSSSSIPSGWALCNGATVNLSDGSGTIVTPDLRDRTVIGAGGSIATQGTAVGATTSSATTDTQGIHTHTIAGGNHNHTFTSDTHVLTINEMPAHSHGNGVSDDNVGNLFPYGTKTAPTGGNVKNDPGSFTLQGITETVGGGAGHSHTGTTDVGTHTHTLDTQGAHAHAVTVSTLQPSLALHWIMKV